MRVEVTRESAESAGKLEIPWKGGEPGGGYFDLRENARALEHIEPARRYPPLRNFLVALNSDDSFFATVRCKAGSEPDDSASEAEPCVFSSRVDLIFAPAQLNLERGHYDRLTERLSELLQREVGSASLRARLSVCPCDFPALAGRGFCLRIVLAAGGATPEQAELRWGLALARLQQALLFSARLLRQQIAQAS